MQVERRETERPHPKQSIQLVTPEGKATVPFIYDLKVCLLSVNEETGTKALNLGDFATAAQAFQDNLKLFHQGPVVMGEGLQYLATLESLKEMGITQPKKEPKRDQHIDLSKLVGNILKRTPTRPPEELPIVIELNQIKFNSLVRELLEMQEKARGLVQAGRVEQISALFNQLEQANLWKRPSDINLDA